MACEDFFPRDDNTAGGLGSRSSPSTTPWGHPNLVLARAVAKGVLTPTEADLIGAPRHARHDVLTLGGCAMCWPSATRERRRRPKPRSEARDRPPPSAPHRPDSPCPPRTPPMSWAPI